MTRSVHKLHIDINIPAQRYVQLYSGSVQDIYAVSREGVSVRFPGKNLNRFVTRDGICGTFEIQFDANNKLVKINKLG